MGNILHDIHGRYLGFDHDYNLQALQGYRSGKRGNLISLPSPNHVVLFDDFESGFDTGRWLATEGTDAATSNAAILAGGIGGVLRLTTGDAGTGLAADTEQITQNQLMWQASNGGLAFQTRVNLSAITTCWAFFGFTDTVAAALEAPYTISGATYTSNATDAVGFLFDTGATTDNIKLVGVKNDVDAANLDAGVAFAAAQYATLRVELDTSGNAHFFINGLFVGYLADAVTAATDLTAIMAVSKLSVAASMTADIDYVHVAMNRAADGGAV
mgnify:CR=1 FL=1